jgi:hypothetical protein
MTTNSPTSRRQTVAGRLAGRRWRQLPLEATLASGDPDDIPRAAGLLGELFVQQGQAGAAEHAYRAAIDSDHPYWSPVAQVALAQLLGDRGRGAEAKPLLEEAITSGDPRTASVAQASLSKLSTGVKGSAVGPALDAYETLSDPVARKTRKSVLAGLISLAAGVVAAAVLVSGLGAETAVSTAAEHQESDAAARHSTDPRTADTAAWLESRTVRQQIDRIASGQISTDEFKAIAGMRVTDGDWTPDMVDRIVDGARTTSLSRLYQDCQVYSAGEFRNRPGC